MFSFRIKTVFHTDEKMLWNLLVLECLPVPPVLSLCSIHMDSNDTESSFQAKNDKWKMSSRTEKWFWSFDQRMDFQNTHKVWEDRVWIKFTVIWTFFGGRLNNPSPGSLFFSLMFILENLDTIWFIWQGRMQLWHWWGQEVPDWN